MAALIFHKLKNALPGVRKGVFLAGHTTFGIGGRAKFFFEAKNKKSLIKAAQWAKHNGWPFFVLGGGSNILIADAVYDGLAIKCQMSNVKCPAHNDAVIVKAGRQKLKIKNAEINVDAGAPLNKAVKIAFDNGLSGLEWAAGIPGSVGGAVRGNAGAFGGQASDMVQKVEAYDVKNDIVKVFSKNECRFAYKNSIFKEQPELIILSVIFSLKKGGQPAIKEKMKEYLAYRAAHHPLDWPSAGCIFKNPPGYRAAELIEAAGLKGKTMGGAQVSEKHANFIINRGGAKASDVSKLIVLIKKKVKERSGVKLEEEIQMLNFGV